MLRPRHQPLETLVGLAVSLKLLKRSWRASELPLWQRALVRLTVSADDARTVYRKDHR